MQRILIPALEKIDMPLNANKESPTADRVAVLLTDCERARGLFGEQISQTEHALQAAWAAEKDGLNRR